MLHSIASSHTQNYLGILETVLGSGDNGLGFSEVLLFFFLIVFCLLCFLKQQKAKKITKKPKNQKTTVAWLGIVSILSVMLGGICFGCMADIFRKQMKSMIIFLALFAGILFLLFILICNQIWDISIFIAISFLIVASFLTSGTYGIAFEAGNELVFPCGAHTAGLQQKKVCFFFVFFLDIYLFVVWFVWSSVCLGKARQNEDATP